MMAVMAADDSSLPFPEAPCCGSEVGLGLGDSGDVHTESRGKPHKFGLPRNAALPNLVRVAGTVPDKLLLATLNNVKFARLKGGMGPEKELLPRFSKYRCEKRPIEYGMVPLNLPVHMSIYQIIDMQSYSYQ